MNHADALAAESKAVLWVWDFPDLQTRFATEDAARAGMPGGWTFFGGALARPDSGSRLDVRENSLTVASAGFNVADPGEAILRWLADHDDAMSKARVVRREGLASVPEADWPVTYWVLADYSVEGDAGGGWHFELQNVLHPMTRPLFEDFGGETYRLSDGTPTLAPSATSITLDQSVAGKVRVPGFVAIYSEEWKKTELVRYTGVSGAQLTGCTRHYYGVGGAVPPTWEKDKSTIAPVWVKRGNPLDVALQLLTTTAAGGNGAYDTADGDGLGIPVEYLNVAAIEALRNAYWPQPTWSGDALASGTAVLFVEREKIDDTKEWIERHILRPLGCFPATDAQERWTVARVFAVPPAPPVIGDEWNVGDFEASDWSRNFEQCVNAATLLADWDLAEGEHAYNRHVEHAVSVTRYGRSKPLELEGRGFRTGKNLFPDFGGAALLSDAAQRVFLELANPWTDLSMAAFYKHKARGLTEPVRVNVPGVPDLAARRRGLDNALFLICRRQIDAQKGRVLFDLRLRRTLTRPAVVAPNTVSRSYSTASTDDRQFCYACPSGQANFANGDEAYTVVPT